MKLTLKEVIDLNYELNGFGYQTKDGKFIQVTKGLIGQKTSMKLKLYFQRLNKIVQDEIKTFEELRKELVEKYEVKEGEDVNPELEKEYSELMKAEKEIDVQNLWSGDVTIDSLSDIQTEENYPIFLKLIDK